MKSEISKPGFFVDPLNAKKMNPLAGKQIKKNIDDPLTKAAKFTAANSEFVDNTSGRNFEILKNVQDGGDIFVKDHVVEFKNAEKKKEMGIWSGIREDFVKIFDLKNMEHFINNVKILIIK